MSIPSFNYLQLEDKKVTNLSCISCIIADGDKIYVAGLDGNIKIWTFGATSAEGILKGHTDLINSMIILKDKTLLSASDDNSLIQWDLKSRVGIIKFTGHEKSVTCCITIYNRRLANSLNIERDFTVVSGSWDQTIRIWDIDKKRALRVLKGHLAPIKTIEYYQIGANTNLVSGSCNGEIYVWDLLKFSPIYKIQAYSETVNKIVLKNGNLISTGNESAVRVWSKEMKILETLTLRTANVRKVVLFRDKLLVALCGAKTIEVWNYEKKYLIEKKEFSSNLFEVNTLDDQRMVIASRNEGWIFKYVNKSLLLIKLLHKFRAETQYPPIVVKLIHNAIME